MDPDTKTRGIKERKSGRGSEFLRQTPCPAVICEPFFGDNEGDWSQWGNVEGRERLGNIYANACYRYFVEG